jgi:hypothetical protein
LPAERFAERSAGVIRVKGEIVIQQSVETVFDFVADERNEPRYNPRLLLAEQISPGPIGLGTRFRAEAASRGRPVEMVIEFTAYERPRRLSSPTRMSTMDDEARGCGDTAIRDVGARWRDPYVRGPSRRLTRPSPQRIRTSSKRQVPTTPMDHSVVTNDARQLMSPLAPTHPSHAVPVYTTVLAWIFIAVCVVGGAYEAAFGPRDARPILAALILFAGAVLVAAGMFAARRNSPWLAVALVTLGALVVGLVFFWTIVGLIIAIALIVLFVMDARRGSSVAARAAAG